MPNKIELGKKPTKPRYLWLVITESGNVRTGLTWRGLEKLLQQGTDNHKRYLVIDLVDDEMHSVPSLTKLLQFMESWRERYLEGEKIIF